MQGMQKAKWRCRLLVRNALAGLWVVLAVAAVFACEPGAPPASSRSAAAASLRATTTALERVFRARRAEASWFAPSLLADCPIERLQDELDVLHDTVGDLQAVLGNGREYVARFSGGEKGVQAKLDEEGRFVVFLVEAR